MLIVGLTGGIASGKNSVAKQFLEFGAFIIDADLVARVLVVPGSEAWHEIVNTFGQEIVDERDEIDRGKLGKIIFTNPTKREKLNKILHPKIIAQEWKEVSKIKETNPEALIIINAALLIESGSYKDVDTVILLSSEKKTAIQRIVARDGLSEEEALARFNSQMSLSAKKKYADFIIENDGSLEDLKKKVVTLTRKLKRQYKEKFTLNMSS